MEEPHFHKLILNSQQFKKISNIVMANPKKSDELRDGYETSEILLTTEHFDSKQFDGMNSIE